MWPVCKHVVNINLAFPQIDGEVDELAVLLDEVLDTVWFQILVCLFLEVETDGRSTAKCVAAWILHYREWRGIRLPDMLFIIVVFWRHDDTIRNCPHTRCCAVFLDVILIVKLFHNFLQEDGNIQTQWRDFLQSEISMIIVTAQEISISKQWV